VECHSERLWVGSEDGFDNRPAKPGVAIPSNIHRKLQAAFSMQYLSQQPSPARIWFDPTSFHQRQTRSSLCRCEHMIHHRVRFDPSGPTRLLDSPENGHVKVADPHIPLLRHPQAKWRPLPISRYANRCDARTNASCPRKEAHRNNKKWRK
jgi:hypothetical protein